MAVYKTYDQVGAKEDVSDIISDISPTNAPFTSSTGREDVSNTLFEWQEDELRAVQANAQVEGFTATDATLTPTLMRQNYTQILEKTIKVSGSADKRATYRRAKESAYQMAKAMKEVKRDLEHAFVGTGQAAAVGATAVARTFAGVQSQIVAGNITFTGGVGTAPTEVVFLGALQDLYDKGVDPRVTMVTPTNSLVFADFAKASGRNRDIKNDKTIVNAVDLYVSPFGEVSIQINRWLKAGDTFIYDPDMWKVCVFRNWFRETLAKDGDNTKMMVVGEFSLKHKNHNASALIRQAVS